MDVKSQTVILSH